MSVDGVTYVAAVALGLAFAVAAVAKLRHLGLTEGAFDTLGIRNPRVMARVVPAAELVIATLLVVAPPIGGLAAIVALGAFSIVLARVIRSGSFASCACFGSSSQRPVSRVDLWRNAGLGLAAVLAVLARGPVVPGAGDVAAVILVGGLALVALANAASRGVRR